LSSFGLFWIATLHLATAGTDAANPIATVTVDVAAAAVVFLTLVRTLTPRPSRRALPATAIHAGTLDSGRDRVAG
jgi:hypothetical protein